MSTESSAHWHELAQALLAALQIRMPGQDLGEIASALAQALFRQSRPASGGAVDRGGRKVQRDTARRIRAGQGADGRRHAGRPPPDRRPYARVR